MAYTRSALLVELSTHKMNCILNTVNTIGHCSREIKSNSIIYLADISLDFENFSLVRYCFINIEKREKFVFKTRSF